MSFPEGRGAEGLPSLQGWPAPTFPVGCDSLVFYENSAMVTLADPKALSDLGRQAAPRGCRELRGNGLGQGPPPKPGRGDGGWPGWRAVAGACAQRGHLLACGVTRVLPASPQAART